MIEFIEACRNWAGVMFWLLADLFLIMIWVAVILAALMFVINWLRDE